MPQYLDIAGAMQYAKPVSAYLEGRAMQMAYKNDQLQQKMLQAQVDALPAQMEEQRQLRALEYQERVARLEQLTNPRQGKFISSRQIPGANSNFTLYIDPQGDMTVLGEQGLGGGRSKAYQQGPQTAGGNMTVFDPDSGTYRDTGVAGQKSLPGYGVAAAGAEMVSGAKEKGKLDAQTGKSIADVAWGLRAAKRKLETIRTKLAGMRKTGVTAQARALIDPDLQELRSLVSGQMLSAMQTAKAGGASFGQMTWPEWELIGRTGLQLQNQPEANERIVGNLIRELDLQEAELRGRVEGGGGAATTFPWDANNAGPADLGRYER